VGNNNKEFKRNLSIILALGVIFLVVAYFVEIYRTTFESFIYQHYYLGIYAYIFFGITATVAAPVSALPLLPLMSQLYGWFLAGIYSIVAWAIGSYIAFLIARKWGKAVVKKLIPLEQLERIEAKIPEEHIFWNVVLLRVIIPVDALSYALGIFTNMRTNSYMLATVLGITPFAFIWAYLGTLPWQYIFFMFSVILVFYVLFWFFRKHKMKKV